MTTFNEYLIYKKSRPIIYEIDSNGCWICTSHKPNGSGYTHVRRNGKRFKTHRYMYECIIKAIDEGLHLCHSCDVPLCINPYHMFEGTALDNMKDRDKKKRRTPPCGVLNGRAKLNEAQVKEIRRLYKEYEIPISDLAFIYSIGITAIHNIVNNKSWRHI